jgi:hypothetical protein
LFCAMKQRCVPDVLCAVVLCNEAAVCALTCYVRLFCAMRRWVPA